MNDIENLRKSLKDEFPPQDQRRPFITKRKLKVTSGLLVASVLTYGVFRMYKHIN